MLSKYGHIVQELYILPSFCHLINHRKKIGIRHSFATHGNPSCRTHPIPFSQRLSQDGIEFAIEQRYTRVTGLSIHPSTQPQIYVHDATNWAINWKKHAERVPFFLGLWQLPAYCLPTAGIFSCWWEIQKKWAMCCHFFLLARCFFLQIFRLPRCALQDMPMFGSFVKEEFTYPNPSMYGIFTTYTFTNRNSPNVSK